MYAEDPGFGTIKAGDNPSRVQRCIRQEANFSTTKSFGTWAGYEAGLYLPTLLLNLGQRQKSVTKRPLVKDGVISRVLWMPCQEMVSDSFSTARLLDKIVLEQFNLRALVRSFQDGFGDNWRTDRFVGSRYAGQIPNPLLKAASKEYNLRHENSVTQFIPQKMRYVDFYEFRGSNGNSNSITIADFNGLTQ